MPNTGEVRRLRAPQPLLSESPWGMGATAGFGLAIGLLFLLTDELVVAIFSTGAVFFRPEADPSALEANGGLLLALMTFASALLGTALVAGLARLRPGMTVRRYLALVPVGSRDLVRFLVLTLLVLAAADALTLLLGRPLVPEVMKEAYRTATIPLLYWAALVLVAPFSEEILFRGFLFKGLLHSRMGGLGAIVFTSFAWTVIHPQYDLYSLGQIFGMGLLLGYARLVTGSLWTAVAMHLLLNFVATCEIAVVLRLAGGP